MCVCNHFCNCQVPLAVFLDLSNVFDMLDGNNLFYKLEEEEEEEEEISSL